LFQHMVGQFQKRKPLEIWCFKGEGEVGEIQWGNQRCRGAGKER
jgi:hypothetical protein